MDRGVPSAVPARSVTRPGPANSRDGGGSSAGGGVLGSLPSPEGSTVKKIVNQYLPSMMSTDAAVPGNPPTAGLPPPPPALLPGAPETEPPSLSSVSNSQALFGLGVADAERVEEGSSGSASDPFDLEDLAGRLAQQERARERGVSEALHRADLSDEVAADALGIVGAPEATASRGAVAEGRVRLTMPPANSVAPESFNNAPGAPRILGPTGGTNTNPFRNGTREGLRRSNRIETAANDDDWTTVVTDRANPLFNEGGNPYLAGAEESDFFSNIEVPTSTFSADDRVIQHPFPWAERDINRRRPLQDTNRPVFLPQAHTHRINGFPQNSTRNFTDLTDPTLTTTPGATTTTATASTTTNTFGYQAEIDQSDLSAFSPSVFRRTRGHGHNNQRFEVPRLDSDDDGPFEQIPLDDNPLTTTAGPSHRPTGNGSSTGPDRTEKPVPKYSLFPRPHHIPIPANLPQIRQHRRQPNLFIDGETRIPEGAPPSHRGFIGRIIDRFNPDSSSQQSQPQPLTLTTTDPSEQEERDHYLRLFRAGLINEADYNASVRDVAMTIRRRAVRDLGVGTSRRAAAAARQQQELEQGERNLLSPPPPAVTRTGRLSVRQRIGSSRYARIDEETEAKSSEAKAHCSRGEEHRERDMPPAADNAPSQEQQQPQNQEENPFGPGPLRLPFSLISLPEATEREAARRRLACLAAYPSRVMCAISESEVPGLERVTSSESHEMDPFSPDPRVLVQPPRPTLGNDRDSMDVYEAGFDDASQTMASPAGGASRARLLATSPPRRHSEAAGIDGASLADLRMRAGSYTPHLFASHWGPAADAAFLA